MYPPMRNSPTALASRPTLRPSRCRRSRRPKSRRPLRCRRRRPNPPHHLSLWPAKPHVRSRPPKCLRWGNDTEGCSSVHLEQPYLVSAARGTGDGVVGRTAAAHPDSARIGHCPAGSGGCRGRRRHLCHHRSGAQSTGRPGDGAGPRARSDHLVRGRRACRNSRQGLQPSPIQSESNQEFSKTASAESCSSKGPPK